MDHFKQASLFIRLSSSRSIRTVKKGNMVTINRRETWWADLSEPAGSEPGFRRPVVIVQGNPLNRSKIATVVCVPLTSNLIWVDAAGNVILNAKTTGLPKDSVANVSQIITKKPDQSQIIQFISLYLICLCIE